MGYATGIAYHHERDAKAHANAVAQAYAPPVNTVHEVAEALAALRALLSNDPTHLGYVECLAEASKPPDVNAAGPDGATPLVLACARGDDEFVDELLKVGADPTVVGCVWLSEYHAADGTLIQSEGKYSRSPLAVVACDGNIRIAEMLLAPSIALVTRLPRCP